MVNWIIDGEFPKCRCQVCECS